MRAYQFISEKAVSKKQQQFFGIVRAMQKGDMPKSGEAGEVAKDMKKSDVKDFAKTKHKGLPTKKKTEGAEITMWTNPAYQGADVDDDYYKKQTVKVVDVSKLTPFEPADKMDAKDNHDNMMKFVDKIKAGEKIKPIVIVPHEGKLLIVDGHHRYFAHLKAGADKIRAVIADPKDLTWRDDVPESMYEDLTAELNPKSEIYVDMDGVLADFFSSWKKITGKDWRDIKGDDLQPALQAIRDDDNFWLDLPLTSNAKKLLGIIKQVKGSYKILSAPLAGDKKAEPHKREWVAKNLDFFPPTEVIITKDKAKYATNPDGTPNILIDDYGVNIAAWESAGGIGFKHKDHKFERTAKKLKAEIEENFQHAIRNYIEEGWSKKYKDSINCSNPKGFSQKAHCAGKKKNEDIEENFADGKKKGKSRPGRVKKSGASCKGSVTSLRAKAKKYGGEKGRMYHWCANMKGGKKKAK